MQTLRPNSNIANTGWSASPSLYSNINDADDGTEATAITNGSVFTVGMQTGLTPNSGTRTLNVRAKKSISGGQVHRLDVELRDSSDTLIQSFSSASITNTTFSTFSFTVTNSIGSYSGLRVKVTLVQVSGGLPRVTAVADVWFEIPDGDPPTNSCPVSLLNQLSGADSGGSWTYLGYHTDDDGTPGEGGSTVGTLTGDNPSVDFEGFVPGFYFFQYCGGSGECADCETLRIEVIPGMFCQESIVDKSFFYCAESLTSYNLYSLLGLSNTTTCKIISAVSTGANSIDSGDISVSGGGATVDLTGYGAGAFQLTIRIANAAALDIVSDLECEACYEDVLINFYAQVCVVCEVEAGTSLATEICNNAIASTISLKSRLTGADAGGSWTYLGYSATEMGSPGGGGSSIGTLTGDNPTVDFSTFTPGYYHLQYCVVNENLPDCDDCETLVVHVVNCACDVEAGTALETTVCNNTGDTDISLRDRLSGEDTGGGWTYLGYSATEMGSPGGGGSSVGALTTDNPTVDFNGFVAGFYHFEYCITSSTLEDCEDCVTLVVEVTECEVCEVEAGTALPTEICNNIGITELSLRSRLSGADTGGGWTYLGYSATEMGAPGGGGSSVGALSGDNPAVDFLSFTPGWYHFEYCVENESIEGCEDCVTLKVHVEECDEPCEDTNPGTPQNVETCN